MSVTREELIPTRTTLLERLKDWQDDASWRVFFDTYWKLVYGVAIKRGLSEAEAQDVVQETMIAVARHMPTFKYDRNVGSFKGWLLNMTRWRITDQFRKRQPFAADPPPLEDAETGTMPSHELADPQILDWEKLWDTEWEKNLLDRAMNNARRRLDPEKFQIFDFYVNKEWPPEKVARTFGIQVDQVYSAKHRVVETIKQEVERLKREMI
jgi:RNA polymerase sigma factor (sigma-70 family)